MRYFALFIVLAIVGCSGNTETPSPIVDAGITATDDAGNPSDVPRCHADPELLERLTEQIIPCRELAHCPCGSLCNEGVCMADCQAGECGDGEICNRFGQCVAQAHGDDLPTVSSTISPHFEVSETSLVTMQLGLEHNVSIRTGDVGLERLNLYASPGSQVRCQPNEDFAANCRLNNLAERSQTSIAFRATNTQERPRNHWSLRLVSQGREVIVDLHQVKEEPPSVPPLQGYYSGSVELDDEHYPIRLLIIDSNDRRSTWVLKDEHGTALGRHNGETTLAKATLNYGNNQYTGEFEPITLQTQSLGVLPMTLTIDVPFALIENGLVRASLNFVASNGGTQMERLGFLRARWTRDLNAEETRTPTINVVNLQQPDIHDINPFAAAVRQHIDIGFSQDWAWRPDDGWNIGDGGTLALCGTERGRHFNTNEAACQRAQSETGCNCSETCFGGNCTWYCGFPSPTRAQCMERLLCYQGHQADELNSLPFSDRTGDVTGDPRCVSQSGSGLQQTFPGLGVQDLDSGGPNLETLLRSCVEELNLVDLPNLNGAGRAALITLLPQRNCFGPARFHTVLEESMRNLVTAGERNRQSTDRIGAKMFQHLTSSWIRLHTFLADETQRAQSIARIVTPQGLDAPSSLDVGAILVRSWELFLLPRVQTALSGIAPQHLSDTDYRPLFDIGANNPNDPQTRPLAQHVIEGLSQHLSFFEHAVKRQRFLPENEPEIELASAFLIKSRFIEDLAHELAERTGDGNWRSAYNAARAELRSARRRLTEQIALLRTGNNPLGITDSELIILPNREEQGGIARYFSNAKRFAQRLQSQRDRMQNLEGQIESAWQDERQAQYHSFQARGLTQDIAARYRDGLAELCGDGDYTELITAQSEANAEQAVSACFIDQQRRTCQLNTDEFIDELSSDDLAYQVCVMARLRQRYGDELATRNEELNTLIRNANEQAHGDRIAWVLARVDDLKRAIVDHRTVIGRASIPDQQRAKADCGALLPTARQTIQIPKIHMNQRTRCYQGTLGEQAIAVLLAAKQIESARAQVAALHEDYDLSMSTCFEQRALEDQRAAMQSAHEQNMRTLGRIKVGADLATMVIHNNLSFENVLTFGDKVGATSVAQGPSILLGASTAEVERSHYESMQQLQAESALRSCYINAQRSLIGLHTAANQIEEAYLRFEQAQTRLANLGGQAVRLIERARGELRRAERRPRAHLALRARGEVVKQYEEGMMHARRLGYLTVRALESAQQTTLPTLRRAALGARNTLDLRTLGNAINQAMVSETVHNQTVANNRFISVISLKEHLLIMQDTSDLNPRYQNLTAEQSFGGYLTRSQHAVYDNEGNLEGYRIPFSVLPYQAVSLFRPESIAMDPLFSAQTCAERLWSMAVSFTGPRTMHEGSNSLPIVNILKSNTFLSQSCQAEEGGFVSESMRTWGHLNPEPSGDKKNYTEIAYQVLHNETVQALSGDTIIADRTFAGTGIFGDYALYFPAPSLATDANSSGLHLERIQDILLRFEYHSATAPQR